MDNSLACFYSCIEHLLLQELENWNFPAILLHWFFPPYFSLVFPAIFLPYFSGVLEVSGEDTKYKMLMRGNEHPWYENIKITCKECDNQFWLGQFMKHIILNHKMPIKVSTLFIIFKNVSSSTSHKKKLGNCEI